MGDLVLITGATGHVGCHVLLHALDAGYAVRVAVRSQDKAESLLAVPALKGRQVGARLSFVVVPDLTKPGAYDAAVQGVRYIIHVASPLPTDGLTPDRFEKEMLEPAVQGTLGILVSAKKTSGVRRIVITSSTAALVPAGAKSEAATFTAASRTATPPVSSLKNPFQAYAASKVKAFNETEAWIRRETPEFDVVNVHPSFVMGREEVHPSADRLASHGTNRFILGVALGVKSPEPISGTTVHVDDVASVHVGALDAKVPGNTSYLVASNNPVGSLDGTVFDDAAKFVAKHFPDAVASGTLPNNGTQPSVSMVKFDTSKTESTFGFTHIPYEEQVKDVVGQYLELVAEH
ncbi:putative oxidoreductase [Tolypocladium capitatum]|uniref:Putative oxidoreductase n=1 Tax=Tolypocladium capitatum TaxID=45235 RepID=A0A2K3QGU3_9HYPO|nr:putative oxidoreductase [Tolypocladium capitatum]